MPIVVRYIHILIDSNFCLPTSSDTLLRMPPLSATYTEPLLSGSAAIARILLWSLMGFPFVFRDFSALRRSSSKDALNSGIYQYIKNSAKWTTEDTHVV